MNLKEKIVIDLKESMIAKDAIRTETLRSIKNEIMIYETSPKAKDKAFTDNEGIAILRTLAKKRKESMDVYRNNNRPELAHKEEQELAIIQEYLPQQMDVETIASNLKSIVEGSSEWNVNKLVGAFMKLHKGKADGTLVREQAELVISSIA